MSDEIIVRHCAPTLAGIKTGSLFPYRCGSRQEAIAEIRSFNRQHLKKGLCLLPLRYSTESVLLLLIRPDKLRVDLQNQIAAGILAECGYTCTSCGEYITALVRRFSEADRFPHEIGLFIGYPPDDVLGFIRNNAQNYKKVGLWKVYGDEEYADSLFCAYAQCSKAYASRLEAGMNLEQILAG